MPMDVIYLDIIVDVPAVGDRPFTYWFPHPLTLPRGAKVRVPFGGTKKDGFVLRSAAETPTFSTKPVEEIYDLSFLPPPELLDLAEALGRHYCASTASAWSCLYPPVVPRKSVAKVLKEGDLPSPLDPENGGPEAPGSWDSDLCGTIDNVPVQYYWGSAPFRWDRYLRLAETVLLEGRSVLFLCPETKVLEGALDWLNAKFPGQVCAVNSEITGLVRRAGWLSLSRGEMRIAAGTRSAAFAPIRDLGLIVLDEEPSDSYKSLDWPFFDARTVALARGANRAAVVFGSAYPSVEALDHIQRGRWSCFREEGRVGPRLTVIDLKESRLGRDIISPPLHAELDAAFASGHRAVLFLNRRGDSTQVSCRDCGNVISCPRCGVPMTYHSKESQTVCHTCGFRAAAPEVCPTCGGHKWRFSGFGIEKAQAEFVRKFPGVPVFRLDQDVARSFPAKNVLSAFGETGPSCLVATQLVLGQSFLPPVAVVGVLSLDTALSVPDFRASERAYRLLSGLKDLVHPGAGSQGAFYVQTRNPDHHAVKGLEEGDHFYEVELQERRMLGYPPFRKLFMVRFEGRNLERVTLASSEFVSKISGDGRIRVLGPAPAPKPRVRGVHRWQVALKGEDHGEMVAECRRVLKEVLTSSAVRVLVDVDPVHTI
jgi:primosomal protein N' (replication factor Y)